MSLLIIDWWYFLPLLIPMLYVIWKRVLSKNKFDLTQQQIEQQQENQGTGKEE